MGCRVESLENYLYSFGQELCEEESRLLAKASDVPFSDWRFRALGFSRVAGFRVCGFRVSGFRVSGLWGSGFRGF